MFHNFAPSVVEVFTISAILLKDFRDFSLIPDARVNIRKKCLLRCLF
jgi:hypothetical protein